MSEEEEVEGVEDEEAEKSLLEDDEAEADHHYNHNQCKDNGLSRRTLDNHRFKLKYTRDKTIPPPLENN
jgi:hypothetical protein